MESLGNPELAAEPFKSVNSTIIRDSSGAAGGFMEVAGGIDDASETCHEVGNGDAKPRSELCRPGIRDASRSAAKRRDQRGYAALEARWALMWKCAMKVPVVPTVK